MNCTIWRSTSTSAPFGEFGKCHSGVDHRVFLQIKVDGSHLNLIRAHDGHPDRDGRRCAASRFGLRPPRLAARSERLTPLPGTSTDLSEPAWRVIGEAQVSLALCDRSELAVWNQRRWPSLAFGLCFMALALQAGQSAKAYCG